MDGVLHATGNLGEVRDRGRQGDAGAAPHVWLGRAGSGVCPARNFRIAGASPLPSPQPLSHGERGFKRLPSRIRSGFAPALSTTPLPWGEGLQAPAFSHPLGLRSCPLHNPSPMGRGASSVSLPASARASLCPSPQPFPWGERDGEEGRGFHSSLPAGLASSSTGAAGTGTALGAGAFGASGVPGQASCRSMRARTASVMARV